MFDQLGVTADLKTFIEEWEPGIHEFYPIKLIAHSTGEETPVTYYILNICHRLQSVVLDENALRINVHGDGQYFWHFRGGADPKMKFHRDTIEGKHIWRDEGARVYMFMSDEFVAAFERHKFRGLLKSDHYDEV